MHDAATVVTNVETWMHNAATVVTNVERCFIRVLGRSNITVKPNVKTWMHDAATVVTNVESGCTLCFRYQQLTNTLALGFWKQLISPIFIKPSAGHVPAFVQS